jgi:hypothetical protein
VSGATIAFIGILAGLEGSGAVVGIWIITFHAALIPFASSVVIASRFNIRSGWYYALCGVLTGVGMAAIYVAVDQLEPRSLEGATAPGEIFETFLEASGLFAPSGLIGAMTYWWKRGRLAGTMTSSSTAARRFHRPSSVLAPARVTRSWSLWSGYLWSVTIATLILVGLPTTLKLARGVSRSKLYLTFSGWRQILVFSRSRLSSVP